MYRYSVVVVTYNRKALLEECLEHLYRQSVPFYEIIVVDNCSTDGTDGFLQAEAGTHENLFVYRMEENLGGAGGFAAGLSKISQESDYTLIIDDDAIIETDFIEKIQEELSPQILAYSGTVMTDGRIDGLHRRRLASRIFMIKAEVPAGEYEKAYFDYEVSSFCGLMIQNKLIARMGLPRADYFIWHDDTEYSLRLKKYTKVRNVNGAVLDHKTNIADRHKRRSWKNYYGFRNQWDLGRTYSKAPALFELYRKGYHRFQILRCGALGALRPADREYYRKLRELHRDVMTDVRQQRFGKNDKYLPGSF